MRLTAACRRAYTPVSYACSKWKTAVPAGVGQPAHFLPILQSKGVEDAGCSWWPAPRSPCRCPHGCWACRTTGRAGAASPACARAGSDRRLGQCAKLGKATTPVRPTRRLAQHGFGIAQVLQRVDLQHHVKAVVVEHGQPLVEVELDHIHPAPARRPAHWRRQSPRRSRCSRARALQVVEHGAVAAAQVEHARAGGTRRAPGQLPLCPSCFAAPWQCYRK